MTDFVFTIDGGGTKTRGILYSIDGDELVTCSGGATNLMRGADSAGRVVNELWRVVCDKLGSSAESTLNRTKIAAGLSGAQFERDRNRFLAGIPAFGDRTICSDGYMALMGATEGQPGSLVVVGTGVVGHRLKESGSATEIGGWGFPIGDVGGGAWLGWKSVSNYVQWRDNRNLNSSMWSEIGKVVGTSKRDILNWAQNATPSRFGQLSPVVIRAMQAGDSVANEIFLEGLHNVYLLSMALKDEDQTCFYAGGLSEIVVKALNARYVQADAKQNENTPNWGAYLVAVGKAPEEATGTYQRD